MAFRGFGRDSGPSAPPKSQPLFGPVSSPLPQAPPFHHHLQRPTIHRAPRDLDAPEEPPFTSVPLQWIHPATEYTRTTANLNRDTLLPGGDQKNMTEKVSSKPLQKRQYDMPSLHPGSRTKFKIPRSQEQGQTHSFVHTNETSIRSLKSNVIGRPYMSHPGLGVGKNNTGMTDAQPFLGPSTSSRNTNEETSVSHAVSKRTRSPPSPARQVLQGKPYIDDDETDRELHAKAKRLARFKAELSVPIEKTTTVSTNALPKLEKQRVLGDYYMESIDDVENEHLQPTGAIIGLCPDMCPVSEREERERKGDLDQYERLDGDRNQSSQKIAVKKYNRTAEREADLIRPMPILQKTMQYLLSLLDQPYDERFLRLYNFLWDRMRAIRMDLRMQHIFNVEAISMLEQMIRLHIIAMHELCEYTRGEGFTEGFDAHLNIEQMNKTSVELFQMYDDHRKRGIDIPTEKEFRGYYALLKLDKHPGYKVEPSELSLDLAQMTRETRQTEEVLFARKVARSCRTGNFIAFFRLARKATYLQSCLMHAHFSKLRTQALASLHSGVQNNQGIPVTLVSKWLGLEEEGVEDLLEYHGFMIKDFEEPYMVKDGSFLNSDKDYPTRCSELVHLKKSKTIVEDVLCSHPEIPQPPDAELVKVIEEKSKPLKSSQRVSSHAIADEKMNEINGSPSPASGIKFQLGHRVSTNYQQAENEQRVGVNLFGNGVQDNSTQLLQDYKHRGNSHQPVDQGSQPWSLCLPKLVPEPQPLSFDWIASQTVQVPVVQSPMSVQSLKSPVVNSPRADERTQFKAIPSGIVSGTSKETSDNTQTSIISFVASPIQHDMGIDECQNAEPTEVCQLGKKDLVVTDQFDEEVAKAKLKLWVRLWRRRSLRKRQMREQNRLAAYSAMNSLSLGPPLGKSMERPEVYEKFDINEIMSKRYDKYDQSWSRINVADLVGDHLCEINAHSHCICWKIILHSPTQQKDDCMSLSDQATLDQWLHCKLMPSSGGGCNDGLVTSSSGLAIWRKWVLNSSDARTCCLTVIKDTSFPHPGDLVGANGILFAISERVPWEHQKMQIHNLVSSLPSGAASSLLILSDSSKEEFVDQPTFFNSQLGLADLDKSKIRSFRFIHLHENSNMKHVGGYYSDEQLREGLKWLAAETRPQPALCSVKTRELVLAHLNLSLEALDGKGFQVEIDPNQCISAFNEALDNSIGHIVAAANANPHGWPCPELSLLGHSSEELRAVEFFLPSIGWSSQEKIQSLVSALGLCKLPAFLEETSFVNRGFCTFDEFEEQRLHLKDCMISYLNQSSKLMSLTLSMKEADVMLQKGARLELRGSSYYLVPNWVMIFRRVFNWKLNRLSGRSWSSTYVLEQHYRHLSQGPEQLDVGASIYQPSLDEMVEVSFRVGRPSVSISSVPQPQASLNNAPVIRPNDFCKYSEEAQKKNSSSMDIDKNDTQVKELEGRRCDHSFSAGSNHSDQNLILVSSRGPDKLSRLLEQCNILQNKIADKLSIYF